MTNLTPKPNGHPIKLVRDRTPNIINASGEPGTLFYAPLAADQVAPWLRRKLAEEVAEYLEDRTVAELADVLAVVEGLAVRLYGLSLRELMAIAHGDQRGGFLGGVMMYGHHAEFDGGV